jgi:hypothetical protein
LPAGSAKLTCPAASVACALNQSPLSSCILTVWLAIGWPLPLTTVTTTGSGMAMVAVVQPGITHDPGAPLGKTTRPLGTTNRYAPGVADSCTCPCASV